MRRPGLRVVHALFRLLRLRPGSASRQLSVKLNQRDKDAFAYRSTGGCGPEPGERVTLVELQALADLDN